MTIYLKDKTEYFWLYTMRCVLVSYDLLIYDLLIYDLLNYRCLLLKGV